jgi:hypothetical protein
MKGELELFIRRNGQLIEHYVDKNLIKTDAKTLMAKFIAGDPASPITHIQFGTSVAVISPDDEYNISNPVEKSLSHTFPTPNSVRFAFTLLGNEALGKSVKEFALRCQDGTVFSYKNRGGAAIDMDLDIEVEGSWTITF